MLYFIKLLILLVACNFLYSSDFAIVTTMFNEQDNQRREEFVETLNLNISNKFISRIFIFFEEKPSHENYSKDDSFEKIRKGIYHEKVTTIPINFRPSFSEMIGFANQFAPQSKIILSNADIYFDDTLALIENYHLHNSLLAITRYEKINNEWILHKQSYKINNLNYYTSHDSWIFKTPFNCKIEPSFRPGFPSCEKFMGDVFAHGYKIANPSLDIRSFHIHASDKRNFEDRDYYPFYPYCLVPLTKLGSFVNPIFARF